MLYTELKGADSIFFCIASLFGISENIGSIFG